MYEIRYNPHKDIIRGLSNLERLQKDTKSAAPYAIFSHLLKLWGETYFNAYWENNFIARVISIDTIETIFDEEFYRLHKTIRQVDFFPIGEGSLDMIFWEFIQMDDTPYNVLKEYYFFCMDPADHPYWNEQKIWSVFECEQFRRKPSDVKRISEEDPGKFLY